MQQSTSESEVLDHNEILAGIPGGSELLERLGGATHFHDAEIVSLHLNRDGTSTLRLELLLRGELLHIIFELKGWIDVHVLGFSWQNVVYQIALKRPGERKVEPWEVGLMPKPGDFELELAPCFGAYGTIRADISGVRFETQ